MMYARYRLILICLVCLVPCVGLASTKPLILTAPPREKPAAGAKLYGPLADYLTQVLHRPVKYVHPHDWLSYQYNMRHDKYDIIFDGPHFASWRMVHLGNTVLVKLPGYLHFYLIAKKTNTSLNTIDQLVAHTFCGIAPPNLSTLSILAQFPNPVQQPIIHAVRGGMPTVMKAFNKGDCIAAVVRSDFFNKKLPENIRNQYKIVFKVPPLPNQSITVSRRVSKSEQALITNALTNGNGKKYIRGIIKRFTGNPNNTFVPANSKEFKGLNNLLEGVIFGW